MWFELRASTGTVAMAVLKDTCYSVIPKIPKVRALTVREPIEPITMRCAFLIMKKKAVSKSIKWKETEAATVFNI